MRDPVIASDGFTYERYAIENWLSRKGTSPMTNEQLPNLELVTNKAAARIIQMLRDNCGRGLRME